MVEAIIVLTVVVFLCTVVIVGHIQRVVLRLDTVVELLEEKR